MKKIFVGAIDRIEGNIAVIIVGEDDGIVEITKGLLPQGAKEGDLVSFKLDIKDKKTLAEKKKIEKLIKKLSL